MTRIPFKYRLGDRAVESQRRMKAVVVYGSTKGDPSVEWSGHESRAGKSLSASY